MSFSHEHKGSLYAILSGILYGFLGYFGVTVMQANFSVSNMLFWRFFISAIVIGLMLLPQLKNQQSNRRDLLKFFFYGTVFYTGSAIFYFLSGKHLGTGIAMVVFFIYPAIVIFLNWILHKIHVSKIYYLIIPCIMMGMIFLIDEHCDSIGIEGICLGVIGATCYSLYVVSSKKSSTSPIVSTFVLSLGCAVSCFIISLLDQSFMIPKTIELWAYILGLGIICTTLPILFFLESIKYIHAEKASVLSVLEPVFVVIFGVLLLHEKITFFQVIGIVIILTSAIIIMLTTEKK